MLQGRHCFGQESQTIFSPFLKSKANKKMDLGTKVIISICVLVIMYVIKIICDAYGIRTETFYYYTFFYIFLLSVYFVVGNR